MVVGRLRGDGDALAVFLMCACMHTLSLKCVLLCSVCFAMSGCVLVSRFRGGVAIWIPRICPGRTTQRAADRVDRWAIGGCAGTQDPGEPRGVSEEPQQVVSGGAGRAGGGRKARWLSSALWCLQFARFLGQLQRLACLPLVPPRSHIAAASCLPGCCVATWQLLQYHQCLVGVFPSGSSLAPHLTHTATVARRTPTHAPRP